LLSLSSSPSSSTTSSSYSFLDQRIPLLNEVWKSVSKGSDITSFINCCSVWIELTHAIYSERELFVILSSLTGRLRDTNQSLPTLGALYDSIIPDQALSSLEGILSSLLAPTSKVASAMLGSAHLLQLIDHFKSTKKVLICKVMHLQQLQNPRL